MSTKLLTTLAVLTALGSMPADAAVGVAPNPWLLEQVIEGEKLNRTDIVDDALARLMMVDAANHEYKLHWLRLALKKPVREEDKIASITQSLCRDANSQACEQAHYILDSATAARRQALGRVELLVTAGQYAQALAMLEAEYEGVPKEHSLALYYYELMLKVPGKHARALAGLRALRSANPTSLVLGRRVELMIDDAYLESLSTFGLEKIYSAASRPRAIRALEKALAIAPDDRRAESWRAALTEGRFWYALDRGDAMIDRGNTVKARAFYEEAAKLDATSPYPYLGLANAADMEGRWDEAIAMTEKALALVPDEKPAERTRVAAKLHNLRILPTLQKAIGLADEGRYSEALKTIDSVKTLEPYHTWMKARWAWASGDAARAQREYGRLYRQKAYRHEARLAVAEILIATGKNEDAKKLLVWLEKDRVVPLTLKDARTAATLYREMGEPDVALSLLETVALRTKKADAQTLAGASHELALLYSEAGAEEKALSLYKKAFVHEGLLTSVALDDATFTHAMRTPDVAEPWMRQSLRQDAQALYQKDNVHLVTGYQVSLEAGTQGYSDLESRTWMTELQMPVAGGTARLRVDDVAFDVGDLKRGAYESQFGTGYVTGFEGASYDAITKDRGQAIALAWDNDTWHVDVGVTPQGFVYQDWTAGLEYAFDVKDVGASVELYRRAKASSLLAYGGQRDPMTGRTWGGVMRTGAAVNFSYDTGGNYGLWAKVSWEALTGHHVPDNDAWQAMGGLYTRVIDRPNREVRLGTSVMLWSFDRDLSGYTLGQGGYYSPQGYASLGFMALDRGRTGDWSWEAQARIGAAWAKTDASDRYPIKHLVPATTPDRDAVEPGESGVSVSYAVNGILERRLTDHWVLGLVAGASKSEGYEPRFGMIYLRYSHKAWQGDLPMPPVAIEPYSAW